LSLAALKDFVCFLANGTNINLVKSAPLATKKSIAVFFFFGSFFFFFDAKEEKMNKTILIKKLFFS